MAVEISRVTQRHSGDLILGACLDYPQTGPVIGYSFEVSGWVVSKAPVAEVQFVHEQSVVASCELTVSRPGVAALYGSSSQVGFSKGIATVGLAPDFTIEVRVAFQDGCQDVIAEIHGTQRPVGLTMTDVDQTPASPVSRSMQEYNPELPRFGRSISFGKSGHSEEVIGPGWSLQEDNCRWMTGISSVLALPIPTETNVADFILMLRVAPYTAKGQIDCQRCIVVRGAETVAEVKLRAAAYAERSGWIGFRISAEAVVSEKLEILFAHPDAGSPQKFGISPDSRELAIAVHEAVLLPVTQADELMGWHGRTGQFVSSDWRAQALVPDWKGVASKFQSMGQNCEFGLVQRACGAEPLGLFRFCNARLHAVVQCLRSEFSEITDEEQFNISESPTGEYLGQHKNLALTYHTFVRGDQNPDVDSLRRKESTRLKILVRLFREDLEDGEKVFVLLRIGPPLDEFEVLPVISLMRRYNPKAALLWITVAGPDERHLVGQCEMVGNNLLKGYIDRFGDSACLPNGISFGSWKDIMVSALQALGRPIPTLAQGLPPEQKQLEMS
jgi:hypothetical protein